MSWKIYRLYNDIIRGNNLFPLLGILIYTLYILIVMGFNWESSNCLLDNRWLCGLQMTDLGSKFKSWTSSVVLYYLLGRSSGHFWEANLERLSLGLVQKVVDFPKLSMSLFLLLIEVDISQDQVLSWYLWQFHCWLWLRIENEETFWNFTTLYK